jgi:hypothetical protein
VKDEKPVVKVQIARLYADCKLVHTMLAGREVEYVYSDIMVGGRRRRFTSLSPDTRF